MLELKCVSICVSGEVPLWFVSQSQNSHGALRTFSCKVASARRAKMQPTYLDWGGKKKMSVFENIFFFYVTVNSLMVVMLIIPIKRGTMQVTVFCFDHWFCRHSAPKSWNSFWNSETPLQVRANTKTQKYMECRQNVWNNTFKCPRSFKADFQSGDTMRGLQKGPILPGTLQSCLVRVKILRNVLQKDCICVMFWAKCGSIKFLRFNLKIFACWRCAEDVSLTNLWLNCLEEHKTTLPPKMISLDWYHLVACWNHI